MRYMQLVEYVVIDPKKLEQRIKSDNSYKNYADAIGDDLGQWLEQYDSSPNNKYVNWMITRYLKGDIKRIEDIPARIAAAIAVFARLALTKKLKPEHKDINRITDLESVVDQYKEIDTSTKVEKKKSFEQEMYDSGDAKLIYNDATYKIVIPVTHEASCYFGKNTKWCTTSERNPNYHNQYSKEGPLYTILYKPDNERWQFHFESDQFMDEEDDPIDLKEFYNAHPTIAKIFIKKNIGALKYKGLRSIGGGIFHMDGKQVSIEDVFNEYPTVFVSMADDLYDLDFTRHASGFKRIVTMDNDVYFVISIFDDAHDLASSRPEPHGRNEVSLANIINTVDNGSVDYHLDINDEDIVSYIADYLDDSNKEQLFNYIEMNSDYEEWKERYSVDDFSELSMDDIVDLIRFQFDDLYNELQSAVYQFYESSIVDEMSNAVSDAFKDLTDDYGATYAAYEHGTVSRKFIFDTPYVLLFPIHNVFSDLRRDKDDVENDYYDGFFQDHGAFSITPPYYGWYGDFSAETANALFDDYIDIALK
jgi:hypothetical protein